MIEVGQNMKHSVIFHPASYGTLQIRELLGKERQNSVMRRDRGMPL